MRFSYWAGSGQTWAELLAGARHAETTGWDGIWVPDHFMPPDDGYGPEDAHDSTGEMGPILEAWTLLAGLAVAVPRVRLGAPRGHVDQDHNFVIVAYACAPRGPAALDGSRPSPRWAAGAL